MFFNRLSKGERKLLLFLLCVADLSVWAACVCAYTIQLNMADKEKLILYAIKYGDKHLSAPLNGLWNKLSNEF